MAGQALGRATPREEGDAKLAELILYIATKSEQDEDFGATKLYKILFYADFGAYILLGRPITGRDYIKMPYGPMPDRVQEDIDALVANGDAAPERRSRFGYPQRRTIALREPNLDLFTAREIAIVDQVLEDLNGMTASQVSLMSHRFIGWRVVNDGEKIPYETTWARPRRLTPEEVAFGLELAASR